MSQSHVVARVTAAFVVLALGAGGAVRSADSYEFGVNPGTNNSRAFAVDVAGQSSGALLVVGFHDRASADELLVMRILPGGQQDMTFAGDGLLNLTQGQPDEYTENIAIAVLPDNRFILLAGSRDGGASNQPSVALYSANGIAIVGAPPRPLDSLRRLAIVADPLQPGVAYIGGTNFFDQFEIRRLAVWGDALIYSDDYGVSGAATADFDLSGAVDDELADLAVAPDGKLVAVGSAQFGLTGDFDFAIARFTTAGLLDTATFSGDGKTTFNVDVVGGTLRDVATSVVVRDDGKIILAGTASNGPAAIDTIGVVAQLTAAGAKDTANFGGGSARVLAGMAEDFVGLVRHANGSLVALGNANNDVLGLGDYIFEGFSASGAIDTTFALNGYFWFGNYYDCSGVGGGGLGGNDGAYALAIANGDVVGVGFSNRHYDGCFGEMFTDIPTGVSLNHDPVFRNGFE